MVVSELAHVIGYLRPPAVESDAFALRTVVAPGIILAELGRIDIELPERLRAEFVSTLVPPGAVS
jgi:hypothetical protein